ncbi:hypothetical protein BHE74_00045876 [Ensete ventricosum]|nr:hypothetical protein BHE74_00045876 [Ensete ventricosum]
MSDDPPLSHRRPSRPSNSYHSFQRQEHIAVSSVTQEQFLGPLNEGQKRLFITKLAVPGRSFLTASERPPLPPAVLLIPQLAHRPVFS